VYVALHDLVKVMFRGDIWVCVLERLEEVGVIVRDLIHVPVWGQRPGMLKKARHVEICSDFLSQGLHLVIIDPYYLMISMVSTSQEVNS
jgi:hypothetical protein